MSANPSEIFKFLKPLYPFRNMPDMQLTTLVEALQEVSFARDQVIYSEGSESDRFYIIYEGRVGLTRRVGDEDEVMGILETGNTFGYEAWDNHFPRQLTVTAITSVRMFYLTTDLMTELSWKAPLLGTFFALMYTSFQQALHTKMEWRDPDEAVIFFCRKHPLFLWMNLLLPLTGLIGFGVFLPIVWYLGYSDLTFLLYISLAGSLISLGSCAWFLVDWLNDDYIVTTQRAISRKRVLMLYDARQEAPLSAILSVTTGTSFWGRRFGYGEVNLRTYTGNIVFSRLPYYMELESLLKEKQTSAQTRYVQTEKRERVQAVKQRLGIDISGQQVKGTDADAAQATTMDSMFSWVHKLFALRTEKGSVITYRTHWLIFLRKTWMPGLLFWIMLVGGILCIFYPISPLPPLAVSGLCFLGAIGVGLWWLYQFIDWRNDLYIITDDQVIDINRKPLGKEEKKSAPLTTIQSIEYSRLGIIGLLFDFGTVYIRVGDGELTFDYVHNPSTVQGEIFLRLAKKRQVEKMTAMKNEGKLILDWIEAYHLAVEEKKKIESSQ